MGTKLCNLCTVLGAGNFHGVKWAAYPEVTASGVGFATEIGRSDIACREPARGATLWLPMSMVDRKVLDSSFGQSSTPSVCCSSLLSHNLEIPAISHQNTVLWARSMPRGGSSDTTSRMGGGGGARAPRKFWPIFLKKKKENRGGIIHFGSAPSGGCCTFSTLPLNWAVTKLLMMVDPVSQRPDDLFPLHV